MGRATMTPALEISITAALTPDVADLVTRHFEMMRSQSPLESCHVMGADALFAAGAKVFVARDSTATLGIAALKPLDPDHSELKSMHTRAEARGKGVGAALIEHILSYASHSAIGRISLETGSEPPFASARRLYKRHGFHECPPFGEYIKDPLSVFMTRTL